jgi:hypothetical protein
VRRACLILLLLLAGCASIPDKIQVTWPERIDFMEAMGDVDVSWRKADFSGSLLLRMEYPHLLFLEVYGAFGQTLVHVKREGGTFLFIAGDEKTTDERLFENRTGLRLQQFMDDLAMQGERRELSGAIAIDRGSYRVLYGHDNKGRRTITWEGGDGTMKLVLSRVSFAREDAGAPDSGGKL